MNYLHNLLEFSTVEEGEKNHLEALKLRDKMGGALYYNILNEDCEEIYKKIQELKYKESKL